MPTIPSWIEKILTNYRLIQNRKSAQKCRQKKKQEFNSLRGEVEKLKQENKAYKEKVSVGVILIQLQLNEITLMLYRKIEENQSLTKRLEQDQMGHTMFLTKLMLSQENNKMADTGVKSDMMEIIRNQLARQEQSATANSPPVFDGQTMLEEALNKTEKHAKLPQSLLDVLKKKQDFSKPQGLVGGMPGFKSSSVHVKDKEYVSQQQPSATKHRKQDIGDFLNSIQK